MINNVKRGCHFASFNLFLLSNGRLYISLVYYTENKNIIICIEIRGEICIMFLQMRCLS